MKQSETPKVRIALIFLILFVGYSMVIAGAPAKQPDDNTIPNIIVIKFKEGVDPLVMGNKSMNNVVNKMMQQHGIIDLRPVIRMNRISKSESKASGLKNIYYASYTGEQSARSKAGQVSDNDLVEYAEPKYRHYISRQSVTPDDSLYYRQEPNYNAVHAPEAWDVIRGDQGSVIIAIVDGGTDIRHEDLQDNIWQNTGEIPNNNIDDDGNGYIDDVFGWNFANNSGDPTGFDNTPINQDHGTHTAGIASAVTDNRTGVAGVSWNTTIMGINVTHPDQDRSLIYGSDGIIYAAENGADVINCSWGRLGNYSRYEEEVIAYATSLGAAVVAAAGNNNSPLPHYPSSYNNVLSIAGTDADDNKWSGSNSGVFVDMAAPAVNIYSLWHGDEYGYATGTSMASPMVAGAVGLVNTFKPELEGIQAAEQVRVTTDSLPAYGLILGRGRLNLYRAVTETWPSIRINDDRYVDEDEDGIIEPGESVELYLSMVNFLTPATNVILSLSTSDPYITMQTAQTTMAEIGMMDTLNADPFIFTVAENTPSAHYINFMLTIESGEYWDYDYVTLSVLPAYGDLYINNVAVTITNLGRIGHPDPYNAEAGIGFKYNEGSDLLFEGAIITGINTDTLSNAARNDTSGYDEDFLFIPGGDITILTPGLISDQESEGKFNDQKADIPLPVVITQTTYAWSDSGNQDYVIFLYTILNTGSRDLNNYYFGLFFDWDIDGGSYDTNMIDFDNPRRLGYVYDSGDGPDTYAGVMALSEGGISFRAIFNDINDPNNPPGAWGLYDGFTDEEKWQSISEGITYTKAGPADVSMVIGNGPYSIPAKSVQNLAFAMLAADDSTSFMAHADSAMAMWERLVITDVQEKEIVHMPGSFDLSQNYPNPFNPRTTINYQLPITNYVELSIYNLLGQKVVTLVSERQTAGTYRIEWDASGLASGVYYYRLNCGEKFTQTNKLILLK